jgi:hypothetical protein
MPRREDQAEILRELWARAWPLSRSRYLIGTEAERTRLRRLEKAAAFSETEFRVMWSDALSASPHDAPPSQSEIRRVHWRQERRKQHDAALEDRGRRLISLALRKELIGLGYATPRQPDDPPSVVPDDCWHVWIGWDKDTVEANGLKMVAVRIISARAYRDAMAIADDRPPAEWKGRPNFKDAIIAEFRALAEHEPQCLAWPRKRLWQAVRTAVQEREGLAPDDERGLSDVTIDRHIRSVT